MTKARRGASNEKAPEEYTDIEAVGFDEYCS